MTAEALATLARFRKDFAFFGENALRILDKAGNLAPFRMNFSQRYIHEAIEKQRAETGKVRVIVLKARQIGCSTYVAARFYGHASLNRGIKVYILAHEQTASDNLFSMVDRFQTFNPYRPHAGVANAKELKFDRLLSGYTVATASQKGTGGRSQTVQRMHASEVGFWVNAREQFASSVQTVPDIPGTEIVLESTGNGPAGMFYELWTEAVAGRGEYLPLFVPWFWEPGYRRTPEHGFELSQESEDGGLSEAEYAALFGLDMAQMSWRRAKVALLQSAALFNQEYPASPEMAFMSKFEDVFIPLAPVLRARKAKHIAGGGPLIMGVDPAGPGGDRFAVCARRGHKVEWVRWRDKVDAPQAVAWLRSLIAEYKPDRVNIDAGGIGHPIISTLRAAEPSAARIIKAVNFGAPSEHKMATSHVPGPKNRRAEMWARLKEWLMLEEGVSIPDMPELQADILSTRLKATLTNDLLLESKEEMRKRGIKSPDLADALALTFAFNEYIQNKNVVNNSTGPVFQEVTALESPMSGTGGPTAWMG